MNQDDGQIQNKQEGGGHFSDNFRTNRDLSMANLAFDHLRDDRNNHNPVSSHLFSGDHMNSSNKGADVGHLQFSNNQSDNGDRRLSMPAPKRTLPTSIVDSLNEDSLFFSGGQQNLFGSGLGSPYLHSDMPLLAPHPQGSMYSHGLDQIDNDSDFDDRGPHNYSLADDIYSTSTTAPSSSDFLISRSASTPASSFATSSSHMMQFQQGYTSSGQSQNQNQSSYPFAQRQVHAQSLINDGGGMNSNLQNHIDQDSAYTRASALQQQQQQGYQQHAPSNLQIHLADIDRRMEIRRGKSAGPGAGPYERSGASVLSGESINMPSPSSIRLLHQQQQQQQLAFLNGRNGNQNPAYRSQAQMDAMMLQQLQQRPASTPLPMSMPSHHMHHMQQQPAPLEHSHKPHGPPLLNLCGLEDSSVEDIVAKSCRDILIEAANHSLKAVELANTLRARVGTEVLAHIRERWGGLLSLLERHAHVFRVERIPKNDLVTLVNGGGLGNSIPHSGSVGGTLSSQSQSQSASLMRGGRAATSSPGFSSQGQLQSVGDLQGQGQGLSPFYTNSVGQLHSASAPPSLPINQGSMHRTQSPPISSGTLGSYSQHYGSSGMGEYMIVNGGGLGGGEGTVSRCLHVGNVPAHMTETQLLRELERYGDVDCLKLGDYQTTPSLSYLACFIEIPIALFSPQFQTEYACQTPVNSFTY